MIPNYITKGKIQDFINLAFQEDIGSGDHSSLACIDPKRQQYFQFIIKSEGILAGVELIKMLVNQTYPDIIIESNTEDGTWVNVQDKPIRLYGKSIHILCIERLLLNCMQRMSGIATHTYRLKQLIKATSVKLLDTRKTTPNFRIFEKWAVKIGGGKNHRMGLYDMIMLKDNHIDACGSITKALKFANQYIIKNNLDIPIEIETRNLEEVREVLNAVKINKVGKVDYIMLDNMSPNLLRKAVKLINKRYQTEASGGITEKNITSIADTGVDFISIGALTHSIKSMDISLKIIK